MGTYRRRASEDGALGGGMVSGISDSGELAPGDRLSSERELAGQFGVSRTVVTDAVKTLSGCGVLRAKLGAENFIAGSEEAAPASRAGEHPKNGGPRQCNLSDDARR